MKVEVTGDGSKCSKIKIPGNKHLNSNNDLNL